MDFLPHQLLQFTILKIQNTKNSKKTESFTIFPTDKSNYHTVKLFHGIEIQGGTY